MKSFLSALLLLGISISAYAQQQVNNTIWISTGITGNIYAINLDDSSYRFVCATGMSFYDIAFTPDGRLWGNTKDTLFQIDTANGLTNIVGPIPTSNSLVGLNDSMLFIESEQNLYSVKNTDASSLMIGHIGHLSDGDMTWLGRDLYMYGQGYLIRMVLDSNYANILSVDALRNNADPYIYATYGLATAYVERLGYDAIIAIPGNDEIYKLDTADAAYQMVCVSDGVDSAWGASSMSFPPDPPLPVSISEGKTLNGELKLYPNPTTGNVYIALLNFKGKISEVELQCYDYSGRLLIRRGLHSNNEKIDLSNYNQGLYCIRLRYRDRDIGMQKIIKR